MSALRTFSYLQLLLLYSHNCDIVIMKRGNGHIEKSKFDSAPIIIPYRVTAVACDAQISESEFAGDVCSSRYYLAFLLLTFLHSCIFIQHIAQ